MNKIKLTTLTIAALFLSIPVLSTAEADETLTGTINVEIKEWIGIVYPEINIDNQSVTFEVNISTDGSETTYQVEDTLTIELNITKNTDRENYIFPRSVFYSIIMTRKILDAKLLPIIGFFKRIFPVREIFKSVNVIKGMLGKEESSINITLNYPISNETFHNGENLTMYIYVMGFLPGDVNGLLKGIPIIDHAKVALNVSYIEK